MYVEALNRSDTQKYLVEGVDYKIEISKKRGLWMSLDRFYAGFESRLDTLGYTPVNGTFSTLCLRLPLALGQGTVAVTGIVAETTITGLCLFTLQVRAAERHLNGIGHCFRHLTHCGLNLGRVCVEFVPVLPWFTCLPYDSVGKILSYPGALEDKKFVLISQKQS